MSRLIHIALFCLFFLVPSVAYAEGGLFSEVIQPAPNDFSLAFLHSLTGNIYNETPQTVFGALFKLYNVFILNVALAILAYYVFFYTALTAANGEFLKDKTDSRLFLRIGLGLALLTTNGSGYSSIQVIVYNIIVTSVSVADYTWSKSLAFLDKYPTFIFPTLDGESEVRDKKIIQAYSKLQNNVRAVWDGVVCSHAHNHSDAQGASEDETVGGNFNLDAAQKLAFRNLGLSQFPDFNVLVNFDDFFTPDTAAIDKISNQPVVSTNAYYTSKFNEHDKLLCFGQSSGTKCGEVKIPDSVYYAPHTLNHCGQIYIEDKYLEPFFNFGTDLENILSEWYLETDGDVTKANLVPKIQGAIDKFVLEMMDVELSTINNPEYQKLSDSGWALAGFYYKNLFTNATSIFTDLQNADGHHYPEYESNLLRSSSHNGQYQIGENQYINSFGSPTIEVSNVLAEIRSESQPDLGPDWFGTMYIKAFNNNFPSKEHPLKAISDDGQVMMDLATVLLIISITSSVTLSLVGAICTCSNPFGAVAEYAAGFIIFFTAILVSLIYIQGVMLAVIIPLIPLVFYAGGVLSWFFAVIEAMVAAPVVALGIAWPNGRHPILSKSEPAIMLLLNLFLRPTLLVIGMFCSIILIWIAMAYIHLGLLISMKYIISFERVIGWITYGFIYTGLIFAIVKRCSALIHEIPDRVLTWVGGQMMSWSSDDLVDAMKEGADTGASFVSTLAKSLPGKQDKREDEDENEDEGASGEASKDDSNGEGGDK